MKLSREVGDSLSQAVTSGSKLYSHRLETSLDAHSTTGD